MPDTDQRLVHLGNWIAGLQIPGARPGSLRAASADASFRRYFRFDCDAGTRIVMDAPPPNEDVRPFLHAARVLADAGVAVPAIHASDIDNGFLLLEDLGDTTLLARLRADPDGAEPLYAAACEQLVRLQRASRQDVFDPYDSARLHTELSLFDQWYLQANCGLALSQAQRETLATLYRALVANNVAQPSVFVHRDWHSRNLMIDPAAPAHAPALGVLDFQDALFGPVTYDLVSLLRDAYIDWTEEQVLDRAVRYWQTARAAGIGVHGDFGDFYRDFEWMGVQRHLKVLGIFSRLAIRDAKPAYLAEIPRVLGYVMATAQRYREFAGLYRLLRDLQGRPVQSALTF